jgi:hypothetical protein
MKGILVYFNYYNFNDLKTTSLELTHPIHASLLFSAELRVIANYSETLREGMIMRPNSAQSTITVNNSILWKAFKKLPFTLHRLESKTFSIPSSLLFCLRQKLLFQAKYRQQYKDKSQFRYIQVQV